MAGREWLPRKDQEFAELCRKWKTRLENSANTAAFGWDPAEVAAVLAVIAAFLTAIETYEFVNSTGNRIIKDEARDAAEKAMRDFANTSIRFNKKMAEEERWEYGVPTAASVSTPASVPKTHPIAETDTSIIRQVTIHFMDSVTRRRGKPYGVHGAEIRWAVLDHVPASVKELVNSDFDTATPFTLYFDESDRGKRLYFSLRWESTVNEKGPFGEIYSAVVP
jgi:hypothetical protein